MIKLDKELVKGSFILLIVFNLYALLNFIFQSSMARLLSVADYGVLAALFYLVYLLSIFAESIQNVFAKTASIEKSNGLLKNILKRAFKKLYPITILFFIFYLIIAIPFHFYKNIDYSLLALNGLFIFTSLFLPITRGLMQGKKKFPALGINLIIEASVKLGLAIFLVWIGWRVYGAIIGAILGTLFALIFSFSPIKDILSAEEKEAKTIEIKQDSMSVFIVISTLLAFYIVDIFIAQLVFSKEIAGLYAIAAILSKAIFWGTQPISKAMFPMSAERTISKEKAANTYFNAFILLSLVIILALAIFFFFPGLIIRIFAGEYINESAGILFYLGLATAILSFANLNFLYKLSRRKPENPYVFFLIFIISIAILFIFNDSLFEYSIAFLTASTIFLWSSIFLLKE